MNLNNSEMKISEKRRLAVAIVVTRIDSGRKTRFGAPAALSDWLHPRLRAAESIGQLLGTMGHGASLQLYKIKTRPRNACGVRAKC